MTTQSGQEHIPAANTATDVPQRVPMGDFAAPRVMSTQHPDNAYLPPFSDEEVLKGEGEIAEAQYVYSKLGCDEQMWDYEGKAADVDVVLKLLLKDPDYYRKNILGKDIFLTLRIPNPTVEHEMRKKVEEALHTIVTSYDLASSFYNAPIAPIFQVILPFTVSADEMIWIDSYYRDVVVGKQDHKLPGGMMVRDWLGEYRPESIQMIPLVEDKESVLKVDQMVEKYVTTVGRDIPGVRIFLARSDPAMNYGMVSSTLSNKVALQRLNKLEGKLGIPLCPMIGVGAVPFRGNFRPERVDSFLEEYPSVQTFTIQSSFKYDNDVNTVRDAVRTLHAHKRTDPTPIDEDRATDLMDRLTASYQARISTIAPLVNAIAPYVPARRDRRLHIGLFGYSRNAGEGQANIRLPRTITYCAALYSIGVPPEIIGLEALTEDDLAFLKDVHPHLEDDLADALTYANESAIEHVLGKAGVDVMKRFSRGIDHEHRGFTNLLFGNINENVDPDKTRQLVTWAAQTRRFLG